MKTKQQILVYLNGGETLAGLIAQAIEAGATEADFANITVDMRSVSCCSCSSDSDGYCYCGSAYDDICLKWSK